MSESQSPLTKIFIQWLTSHLPAMLRSVEASAHLAMFLTATNLALPIINRTMGLVKGQIDDLRQKYEAKTA